jgi:hypothetical protein
MFVTIRFFLADLRVIFGGGLNPFVGVLGGRDDKPTAVTRVAMQIIVSLVILILAGVVLSGPGYSDKTKELVAGLLGTVIGYWLR